MQLSILEKEMLSVIIAITKLESYLEIMKFDLITDNQA